MWYRKWTRQHGSCDVMRHTFRQQPSDTKRKLNIKISFTFILSVIILLSCCFFHFNWTLANLWLVDKLSLSAPAYKDTSLVNKTCGHVVFENNSGALWSCADQTVSSNLWGVIYFASQWGQICLSPGERSPASCHCDFQVGSRSIN